MVANTSLESQIENYFTRPVDGRDFVACVTVKGKAPKNTAKERQLMKEFAEVAAGFGQVWLDEKTFFGAIKQFTGAREVKWGVALERDNWTDGEIHKVLEIDGANYEYSGNRYSRQEAKKFVADLVEQKVQPVELSSLTLSRKPTYS